VRESIRRSDPIPDVPRAPVQQLRRWIAASIRSAPDRRVPTLRTLRRSATSRVEELDGAEVLDLARGMLGPEAGVPRWVTYELVHHHPPAMRLLNAEVLVELGRGMASWGEVDAFACYLSGVAWREGGITDREVARWAASEDRWWRRAAVVSTVPLNLKSRGGTGDPDRTLAMCERVKGDRDDMVVKAVSWALRALAMQAPARVRAYLESSGDALAPRVRREVQNKLSTGLKNPRTVRDRA
jgi:hypothetical protein